jgi:hypothetical protein
LSTMTMKMTSKGLRPNRVVLSNVAVRLKRPLTLRLSIEYQFARAHCGNVPSVYLHLTWAPAALLCQPLFSALETITTTPLDLSFREVPGHVLLLARAEVCYVSTPVQEATASWRGNCMLSSPHFLRRTNGTQLSSINFSPPHVHLGILRCNSQYACYIRRNPLRSLSRLVRGRTIQRSVWGHLRASCCSRCFQASIVSAMFVVYSYMDILSTPTLWQI